ncbi:class I SAM-dependent methyltransferase [Sphingobacterium faecale]|uniref:Methyltransferase domain-containing protein n=1 Tax=Sphingobacterium faecale TaxID=2803775 RepID=A0ABS1R5T1_9SPHI|nr:class I SAM-dependent methyltransferase [Sphingobacterium faecale]MBL1410059.1 methyltransferase domain-containing protein [Sphingobacterium faecale]
MLDMYRMFVVPDGNWGEKGAAMMVDKGDTMAIKAVALLDLTKKDRVIEIGFGPGIALEVLAKIVTDGSVVGIDPSDLMHRLAAERNIEAINKGKIALFKGTVSHLPFDDNSFNGALAMDNMHFWNDPLNGLKELKRVLLPGSKLVCSFTPQSGGNKRGWVELFTKAGFIEFHIRETETGFCLVGIVPK